jgi:hypothetical protein
MTCHVPDYRAHSSALDATRSLGRCSANRRGKAINAMVSKIDFTTDSLKGSAG